MDVYEEEIFAIAGSEDETTSAISRCKMVSLDSLRTGGDLFLTILYK
jgi:hypothetical protein